MARLSTIRPITIHKSVLYCPLCKKPLEQDGGAYVCRGCSKFFPVIDGIPSLADHRGVAESFDAEAFEFLFEMEQKHFWHVGRKEIILSVLKRNVLNLGKIRMLEIGCGNGNILGHLKQNGINIEGGDIFLEGLNFCRKRASSVALYQIDILALPFNDDFDVIGAFDVLEHIDDDEKALVEINRALKTGGSLILTVPAHRFLWSYFDEASRHQRRYNKPELVTKLEQAGFAVKKVSYYMFFLFPLLAAMRMIGNWRRQTNDRRENIKTCLEVRTVPVLNEVFLGLLRLEKELLAYFSLPYGVSLLALAEKR
jgi:SAM-dependent methyltransferase